LKQRLLSFIGSLVIRALHATLRVRHINVENILGVPQSIIAFWHDHLLLMLHAKFHRPITVMSSQSRDGDIAVGIYAHYGVATSRGSSTRGGMAGLRGLIRSARSGSSIVFTPDGPRGPGRVAKEGIIFAAQATGLPIVPIAFAAKKKSYCHRGTAWSSRGHSRRSYSPTAPRSPSRARATSRNGAGGWSGR
jgi:lysophospholipid acyltransferase (LPLAT)-like uncharacterized protein